MPRIKLGRPDVAPDLPAHTPGINQGNSKGNYEKRPELAQLVWDLGVKWLNVQFLTPCGRATKWVAPDVRDAAVFE